MKKKLIDILTSVSVPRMDGDIPIGEYQTPIWFAELLADELIRNGVTFSTFKVGDVVWVYDFMWGPIPCEVDQPYHCRSGKEGGYTFEMSFTEKDIGEYVFATKEEVETFIGFGCRIL